MKFSLKQILIGFWGFVLILLCGFWLLSGNNEQAEAQSLTIFYETFPNSDSAWNGSGDTAQSESGWAVYQDYNDSDSIRISNQDVGRGTVPPSGGNHLTFNDCDYGFRSPEDYAITYVSIDLSGYQSVVIQYYWQSDDVDSGEGLRTAYSTNSTDGKNGTWTAIASHINPTDDRWYVQTFNLPDPACVSNFKLRFSSKSSLTSENVLADDVKLTGEASCSLNGATCGADPECCSSNCALDYDGAGSFCCASGQCSHNGSCYSDGTCQGAYKCASETWVNHCANGIQDCDETGIDCGGADCGSCFAACGNHNVSGWAWAGAPQSVAPQKIGLGWLSFSCENQGTGTDYGVDIESDGNLVGYAYYDMNDPNTGTNEVGWIDFDPSLAGRPGAPNRTARVDLDGTASSYGCTSAGCVYGWARAVGYGGGWDGWIKLRKDPGDSGVNYGVYIDTDDGEFHGWAWGGDVMGWLSFNCDNLGTSCGTTNDYKVQTSFSFSSAPIVSDFRKDSTSYCSSIQKRGHIDFSWLYTGDNPQEEYKIAISTNPGFGGAQEIIRTQIVAPGLRGTSGVDVVPSPTLGELEIGYNDTYYFRVKVKDSNDVWSNDWSGSVSAATPLHAYPWPDFNWEPAEPAVEETVIMDNLSKCYDTSNNETACSSWAWIIPGTAVFVDGTNAYQFEPHIQFFSAGDNPVTLRVSDSVGICEKTKNVGIKLPMPGWIEVPPQ